MVEQRVFEYPYEGVAGCRLGSAGSQPQRRLRNFQESAKRGVQEIQAEKAGDYPAVYSRARTQAQIKDSVKHQSFETLRKNQEPRTAKSHAPPAGYRLKIQVVTVPEASLQKQR